MRSVRILTLIAPGLIVLWALQALGATKEPNRTPTRTPAGSATPAAPKGQAGADVEAGKAAYDKFCKKCHGEKGEGVQRMYDLVDAKLVSLGSRQAQSKSDSEIKRSITDGVGKMEAVEDVTPQQVNQIVAFVRTLKD
jgi:mono/diheme cytochrome c family protein